MIKTPKLTRLEVAIAVISFVCSFGGNLSSEYLKQMWSTNSDIMKTEVVEVRARVLGIVDGSAEPKDSAGCQKIIDTLVKYEGIYRSAEARTLLETGIDYLKKPQAQFKFVEDITAIQPGQLKNIPCEFPSVIGDESNMTMIRCTNAAALVQQWLSSVSNKTKLP